MQAFVKCDTFFLPIMFRNSVPPLDIKCETSSNYVRFEFLTAVKMWTMVFWVAASCALVGGYQRFEGTCRLQFRGYNHLQDLIHGVKTQKIKIDTE